MNCDIWKGTKGEQLLKMPKAAARCAPQQVPCGGLCCIPPCPKQHGGILRDRVLLQEVDRAETEAMSCFESGGVQGGVVPCGSESGGETVVGAKGKGGQEERQQARQEELGLPNPSEPLNVAAAEGPRGERWWSEGSSSA